MHEKVITKGWRKVYIPFLIWITTMVIGFGLLAYLSSQRVWHLEGLQNPQAILRGPDGHMYVTDLGQVGTDGDGLIWQIVDKLPRVFAKDLDDPKGIAFAVGALYVIDTQQIVRFVEGDTANVWVTAEDFPILPKELNALTATADGTLYTTDSTVVYTITPEGNVRTLALSSAKPWQTPYVLWVDQTAGVLVGDFSLGRLWRIAEGQPKLLAKDLGNVAGLVQAADGTLYLSDAGGGHVFRLTPEGKQSTVIRGLRQPLGLALSADEKYLWIVEAGVGRLTVLEL